MNVVNITHGDDADGLICAAILRKLFEVNVFPANYDNLEEALSKVGPEYAQLYITDLNLRRSLLERLKVIAMRSSITIIDHHPLEKRLEAGLRELGVEIIHNLRDCAAALVYDHFKDKLEANAARLAAYAAVSDMFEDGPIASRLLDKMDRKFVQQEALLLSHALCADQSTKFKELIIERLSRYEYPHRIKGVVDRATVHLERIVKAKETIPCKVTRMGNLAYMECDDELSTGEISNVIMDTLLVPVGMCWKKQGDIVNVSLRGERRLITHLGKLVERLSRKYDGFGGGHARASGAKIPIDKLEVFIIDLAQILNAKTS